MRIKLALFVCLFSLCISAQDDKIILRNGQELEVKITQIDLDKVYFKTSNKRDALQEVLELKDVYMLHTEMRGNIYIDPNGERFSGEKQKIGSDATVIYLLQGREIIGYDVEIRGENVFLSKKKSQPKIAGIFLKKRTSKEDLLTLCTKDVFLIKYPDGTRDILNRFEKTSLQQPLKKENEEKEYKGLDLQVVFHNVRGGETLSTIAERYNVSVEDIITWNDLPTKTRSSARLQTDMQLMIYVKPAE